MISVLYLVAHKKMKNLMVGFIVRYLHELCTVGDIALLDSIFLPAGECWV